MFHLKEPLKLTEAAELTFVLEQLHRDRKHAIGRFRISVTDDPNPALNGVPEEIDRILSIVESARTDEQKQQLVRWFPSQSEGRGQLVSALGKSKLPRPVNSGITLRESKIALESQPLTRDPHLVRLERAVRLSEAQLTNLRFTMAQDLAWALVNSPSFLFNR